MSSRVGITLCGVIHALSFSGICKREWSSILIGNIMMCNTNLHPSPSRNFFLSVQCWHIKSWHDLLKSLVVGMYEAKKPWARFNVAGVIFIYIISFLCCKCCQGFMIYVKDFILGIVCRGQKKHTR